MNESVKKINITGIIFCVIVTAGFVWAAMQWWNLWSKPKPAGAEDMKSSELSAFINLQKISQAQKKYKEKDWDGDGKKTYAKYFIHLWTSVDAAANPVFVGLIGRKLGFAFEATRAVDGYYFVDLHDLQLPDNKGLQRLDYEKQWAVLAVPAVVEGRTDVRYLLADSSGSIFIKSAKYVPPLYIDNPASNGWTKIETIQQLQDYQRKVIYPG